ncbi:response regulator transcription factor [Schaalia suimastitidis]|uniref:response regulator transcription factor n=1 Tax=Schaalia suimastitidis TaxID=121163 RepID=UPI00041E8E9F|nr:response regulator transcription factor [Schaalia suimastitidis]
MRQILIVEDEERIASFIAKGLKAAGYSTIATPSGRQAVTLLLTAEFDLVILDVGLEDIDGFEVLEQMRGQGVSTPVIMLTARSSVADRVAGLEGGADDYMAKPFSFDELLARVKLRLRAEKTQMPEAELAHAGMVLNLRTRQIHVDGRVIDLSAREFALAEALMRHPGQILSREQLLSSVWGFDFDTGSNVVDVYISYLRSKLGKDHVETVRGMGYRLR